MGKSTSLVHLATSGKWEIALENLQINSGRGNRDLGIQRGWDACLFKVILDHDSNKSTLKKKKKAGEITIAVS